MLKYGIAFQKNTLRHIIDILELKTSHTLHGFFIPIPLSKMMLVILPRSGMLLSQRGKISIQ